MTSNELKQQSAAILDVSEIVRRILQHVTDQKAGRYGQPDCELDGLDIKIGSYTSQYIDITLYLNCSANLFVEPREQAHAEIDNQRARLFVSKILSEFGGKAARDGGEPSTLHLKLSPGFNLHIHRFPTKVTYKCQKRCIAVLPDGKEIPVEDVALAD